MNNIITKNSNGEYHGYHEWYYNNKLIYRGNFKNNECIGHSEYHWCKHIIYYII